MPPEDDFQDPLDRPMIPLIDPNTGARVFIDLHAYVERRIADAIRAHEQRMHSHQL